MKQITQDLLNFFKEGKLYATTKSPDLLYRVVEKRNGWIKISSLFPASNNSLLVKINISDFEKEHQQVIDLTSPEHGLLFGPLRLSEMSEFKGKNYKEKIKILDELVAPRTAEHEESAENIRTSDYMIYSAREMARKIQYCSERASSKGTMLFLLHVSWAAWVALDPHPLSNVPLFAFLLFFVWACTAFVLLGVLFVGKNYTSPFLDTSKISMDENFLELRKEELVQIDRAIENNSKIVATKWKKIKYCSFSTFGLACAMLCLSLFFKG